MQGKEAYGSVNLCAVLEAGIEGGIHVMRYQEYMGWGNKGAERREKLDTKEQARLWKDLVRNLEKRESGIKM